MSSMIRCDKCKKTMYADSRSDKGDWCTVRIDYVDGLSTLHLCKVCHRQFLVEFTRILKPDEYDEEFGSWWEDEVEGMSYFVPKEIPNCCGRCPCFHAEKLMYCQAVKADKNKRIYAPYEGNRPNWCPLIEVPTPHGDLVDREALLAEYDRQHVGPPGGARRIMEQATAIIKAEDK